MDKLDLNINGHDNFPDVIAMIKDTIDNGDKESAKDYLNQLQEYLAKRDLKILNLQNTGESILKKLEEKAMSPLGDLKKIVDDGKCINDYVKEKAESDIDIALNLEAESQLGK